MSNAYLTTTEFLLRAHPSGSFNGVTSGTLGSYIDSAASEVDAALRPHHTLPLSTTPEVLKDAVSTMASYRLSLFIGSRPTGDDSPLGSRYLEIVSPEGGLLDRISRGRYVFDSAMDATPSTYEGSPKVVTSRATRSRGVRVFDDDGNELI